MIGWTPPSIYDLINPAPAPLLETSLTPPIPYRTDYVPTDGLPAALAPETSGFDWKQIAIWGGVAVGAYFLLLKKL